MTTGGMKKIIPIPKNSGSTFDTDGSDIPEAGAIEPTLPSNLMQGGGDAPTQKSLDDTPITVSILILMRVLCLLCTSQYLLRYMWENLVHATSSE